MEYDQKKLSANTTDKFASFQFWIDKKRIKKKQDVAEIPQMNLRQFLYERSRRTDHNFMSDFNSKIAQQLNLMLFRSSSNAIFANGNMQACSLQNVITIDNEILSNER